MDNQLATERTRVTVNGNDLPAALSAWAAGVTLVTIADDRDDVGTTVSAFMPVSLDPPLVAVSLIAGQFAAEGRPSARLILDAAPHLRGASSGALIPHGGLAALECSVARRVPAGDHLLVISAVEEVVYVAESGDPLVRFRGRYPVL